ncbi:hypothetical protein [Spirosoma endbachense]|uniref:Uncharacterized protein n=1 Tax=Spirosoma endbachense TaxID=2666025 RepID=A0A6P1W5E5_9BACT|nr:hypothetical protein [Spirosoma endbachense]QHV99249.1 hypothetical protein GJR95_31420 [Spirosoma endbachense]
MSKQYDHQILTELDDHFSSILELLAESDMGDDSANGFRDEIYQYINPQQLRLQLIMKGLGLPEPTESAINEADLRDEFRHLLNGFMRALLEKLIANERKYKFGWAWQESDWEEQLQRDLVKHIEKGDPRDTAIFSLFAWHHQWRTGPAPETDEQLEARTERNMNLISQFLDHVKSESGIAISEDVVLSFFNA